MKKKGFEMSIELIITIFIAIVTLAIAGALFTGQLDDLINKLKGFSPPEIEPTATDPISFHAIVVSKGKEAKVMIDFYNNENQEIETTIKPDIVCDGISMVSLRTVGVNTPVGSIARYATIISVPSDTPSGQYPCSIKISRTEKAFIMEVK